MKVVSPFRPFVPESPAHHLLGPFDWIGALQMLRASVLRSPSNCATFAITDCDTDLPVPSHRYATTERRLMLWILDVSLQYLESADFDQDTVMISPDLLVFADLRPWFVADLGVVVRLHQKFVDAGRPLLNSVQFWRHTAKDRLVEFYRDVLAIAHRLPEEAIVWGADTEAITLRLSPLCAGHFHRSGIDVYGIELPRIVRGLSQADIGRLEAELPPTPPASAIVDFKYTRKRYLRRYFDATIGSAVTA